MFLSFFLFGSCRCPSSEYTNKSALINHQIIYKRKYTVSRAKSIQVLIQYSYTEKSIIVACFGLAEGKLGKIAK